MQEQDIHASGLFPKPTEKTVTKERGLLERLTSLLSREPEDGSQILKLLQQAAERQVLPPDILAMMAGAMTLAELSAGDIMIPRAQMNALDVSCPMNSMVCTAIERGHSRYPVFEDSRDNMIGVLMVRDLLQAQCRKEAEPIHVRELLRPAVFIPETKSLNALLADFRQNRNHMALVVDEFGSISGLITIEDVLEQVVGNIEDETDIVDDAHNILAMGGGVAPVYWVRGRTPLVQFNQTFSAQLRVDLKVGQIDTVGGFLIDHLGRVPSAGERITIESLRFEVLRADARHLHVLRVVNLEEDSNVTMNQGVSHSVNHNGSSSGVAPPH